MATILGSGETARTFAPSVEGGSGGSLAALPLFRDLTDDELESLLGSSSSLRADRHQVVYCEGETVGHLYVVENGSFKLVRHSPEGKELIVSLVPEGDWFGAAAEPIESLSLAQALEDSTCLVVPATVIRRTLSKNPAFAVRLLSQGAERHGRVETVAARLAFETVPQRLAHVLLDASDPETGALAFPLNQTEIANLIGSSRETVCSLLNGFRRSGLLDIERGKIRLRDREGLSAVH